MNHITKIVRYTFMHFHIPNETKVAPIAANRIRDLCATISEHYMRIHWIRAAIAGVLAELAVFAIVFPARSVFGQRAFLTSIVIASFVMPLIFALWVCRRVDSHFVLHGALVGIVAALFYLALAWGQPQPLLYRIAHGLKVVGGISGGLIASRRKTPVPARAS